MKLNSFEDLFVCLLSDIYYVEQQLVKDIPHLVSRATSEELKEGLRAHLTETKEQVKRLEKVFNIIDRRPKRFEWASDMKHLFADAAGFLKENEPSDILDAAIIIIAQRIEHFEIATYGALCAYAKVLGYDEVVHLLKDTIKEEGHADKVLTKLAKGGVFTSGVNMKAAHE